MIILESSGYKDMENDPFGDIFGEIETFYGDSHSGDMKRN